MGAVVIVALAWLLCYLIGSIPFGLLLCKAFGYGDIRDIGSGSIGATNVLRTGNKYLALATFLLDTGKGAAAVGIAFMIKETPWFLWGAGLFAVLGHLYPVWLKFHGGKGVATTIGTLTALSWPVGLAVCVFWLVIFYFTRISSVAALGSFLIMPALVQSFVGKEGLFYAVVIAALVYWRHRKNIERLITGTEPKSSFKKKDDSRP